MCLYIFSEPQQTPQAASQQPPPASELDTKTCPRCAETIKAAAVVCRFCNHEFNQEAAASS